MSCERIDLANYSVVLKSAGIKNILGGRGKTSKGRYAAIDLFTEKSIILVFTFKYVCNLQIRAADIQIFWKHH